MADDQVTRNLRSMDELDFTGWNQADWQGGSPTTTPTTSSSMSTGSLRHMASRSTSMP